MTIADSPPGRNSPAPQLLGPSERHDERLFTAPEAAKYLSISLRSLQTRTAAGRDSRRPHDPAKSDERTGTLRHPQPAEVFLPAVERALGHLELAADLRHRCPRLRLPQGHDDLLLRVPRPAHRACLPAPPRGPGPTLTYPLSESPRWPSFGGTRHCRYPLHTELLEGINNKIKVLKRMAHGFRDDAYFFLNIRAAFPGIPA